MYILPNLTTKCEGFFSSPLQTPNSVPDSLVSPCKFSWDNRNAMQGPQTRLGNVKQSKQTNNAVCY